jgi:hypothetical protein
MTMTATTTTTITTNVVATATATATSNNNATATALANTTTINTATAISLAIAATTATKVEGEISRDAYHTNTGCLAGIGIPYQHLSGGMVLFWLVLLHKPLFPQHLKLEKNPTLHSSSSTSTPTSMFDSLCSSFSSSNVGKRALCFAIR